MPQFYANSSFDFGAFVGATDLADFFANAHVSSDTSLVTLTRPTSAGANERLVLSGSFGGFVDGFPTTGTISGIRYSMPDGTSFHIKATSITVAHFQEYVNTGDITGLFEDILSGADRIIGSAGADSLVGFGGNDLIDGRGGADVMTGGTGNDHYIVDSTGDVVVESSLQGYDRVTAHASYTLAANIEVLRLAEADITGTGNESANVLFASDGGNVLFGLSGADRLHGGIGIDTLDGGAGRDHINGGAGADTLIGGLGADVFVFDNGDSRLGIRADTIVDFNSAQNDVIDLSAMDAKFGVSGNQSFTFIGDGAFSNTKGELRVVADAGGSLVQGDLDGDGLADFAIHLSSVTEVTVNDFIL